MHRAPRPRRTGASEGRRNPTRRRGGSAPPRHRSVAYGMPVTVAGVVTSSQRERWFRKVELWIDGAGAVHERAPAAAHRRNRQPVLGAKAKALKPCPAFALAKPTST
jgi:hypothetical protein